MEKTGQEILIDYIKEDAQDSEKSMQNLIFKDDFSKEDEEKISQKAAELLAFLSDKDSAQIREILESVTIEDAQSLEGSSSLLMGKFVKLDDIKDEQTQNLSRSIITLNEELEQINPHKFDFDKKGVLAFIPFVAKPINRYLKKFQSAKEVIKDTLSHIEDGEKILREDNALLQEEKQYYKQKAVSLQRKAVVFEKIVKSIEQNISKLGAKEREFYENNVLLNLNKKIRSIYEILAVTQQGFLSSDLIINTNWELIDNISNVKAVTKRAVEIGIAMAITLQNQKNALETAQKTKKFANDMILSNAQRLNTQASEIYKMSGDATLDIETLKQAFSQIEEAMGKINTFKAQAVEKIKTEVTALKEVTAKLENKIQESQKVQEFKTSFSMDL